MKRILALFFSVTFLANVYCQNVGINISGAAPNTAAILDVDAAGMSPKAGVLMPRMTTVQRDAIPSPANGLLVYNTTTNQINFYNGTFWRSFSDVLSSVTVAGGTGTTQGVAINNTGDAAHPSALLDISSTTQGLLVPQTKDASVASPVAGLVIFSTATGSIRYYNGTSWKSVACDLAGTAGTGGSQTAKGTAINGTGATGHQSAILDLGGTTMGFLLPRVTSAERDLIPSPAQGLVIYNNTTNIIEFFNTTEWRTTQDGVGFKTEWTTTGAFETITLPLNNSNGASFNCIVDWGDGKPTSDITSSADADRIHTYDVAGTYTVEILGQCEGWSFNNAGDKLKIKKVLSWGDPCGFKGFKYLQDGFYGCTALTSLPATGGILASGNGCANFSQLFYNCTSLAGAIPDDLFRYNTQVSANGFYQTFRNCSGLTGAIPTNLFRYNTSVSSNGFYYTFSGCIGLSGSIPSDLFRYNTLVSSGGFYSTFSGCIGLTGTIPTDLFRYNTLVSINGFYSTFQGCSGLTGAIPTDLFRYNTLVSTSAFNLTFSGCIGLTGSIPADLFRYNTAVSSFGFYYTFANCNKLSGSIPADLFRYNTLVSTNGFTGTFFGCSLLTSIPTDLFRYNTAVSSNGFYQTFSTCPGLTSIPADLFKYNILVSASAFHQTFYNCSGLSGAIPSDLFRYNRVYTE